MSVVLRGLGGWGFVTWGLGDTTGTYGVPTAVWRSSGRHHIGQPGYMLTTNRST